MYRRILLLLAYQVASISYRYMAPEVYRHESYTETVDTYSYAMIFFYLLDGKPPWPSENGVVEVKKASEEGDRPAIPRHWDQRLQNLLQECWSENPQTRPGFSKILHELNHYARKYRNDFLTCCQSTLALFPLLILFVFSGVV